MGFVDLDLLFQIPQEYARISGGIERKGKLSKVSNGGERGERTSPELEVGEGYLYPFPEYDRWCRKNSRCRKLRPDNPACQGRIIRPVRGG